MRVLLLAAVALAGCFHPPLPAAGQPVLLLADETLWANLTAGSSGILALDLPHCAAARWDGERLVLTTFGGARWPSVPEGIVLRRHEFHVGPNVTTRWTGGDRVSVASVEEGARVGVASIANASRELFGVELRDGEALVDGRRPAAGERLEREETIRSANGTVEARHVVRLELVGRVPTRIDSTSGCD